jgi:beta-mannosidase
LRQRLTSGWELCSTKPGAEPDASAQWIAAHAPSTAAACLRSHQLWSLDGSPRRFDAEDWWYRVRFTLPMRNADEQLVKGSDASTRAADLSDELVLGFDGLATLADVWLNGQPLLSSDNMFLAHERVLDRATLRADNELLIRFRSLDRALEAKRPRPKWRAPMVENQQLRWFRTTLLGRTPGWSPPAAAVGPWRPVWLETRAATKPLSAPHASAASPNFQFRVGVSGTTPWTESNLEASLTLTRGAERHEILLKPGRQDLPSDIALWWPHTHGEPALYDAHVRGPNFEHSLGKLGFRDIALDTTNGDFLIKVNGVPVFCRGACWTPDPVTLDTPDVAQVIQQVREAGMNMLRVGGTMVYESDEFLDACDANGILLWQDFMFANMEYPGSDATFAASVAEEARQQLTRLKNRPCLALLCGNSEGEQQAAMWGAPRESWSTPLFHQQLPDLIKQHAPGTPYWPSSAHGGSFPHQGNVGTTSYYGVGAYLRPLEDARRAEVRFASECLAFANIPEEKAIAAMPGGLSIKSHHPGWKARTPRDLGAGWDFDDVRDHYLNRLFGVSPLELRYADHDRYLALSRVVPGEVMARTFEEWRHKRSTCHGALIWFYRDLWAGAGWGVVDALGNPKAPYYYLRRVSQPVSVSISDEGGNGLYVHVNNERATVLEATLQLNFYRGGEINVGSVSKRITLAARETAAIAATSLLENFQDLSYAYRFGPPQQDLVVATLGESQSFHFVNGLSAARELDIGLQASVTPSGELTITTRRFAQSVWIEADGFRASDAYFHVAPGSQRVVLLQRTTADATKPLRGRVHALNSHNSAKIESAAATVDPAGK